MKPTRPFPIVLLAAPAFLLPGCESAQKTTAESESARPVSAGLAALKAESADDAPTIPNNTDGSNDPIAASAQASLIELAANDLKAFLNEDSSTGTTPQQTTGISLAEQREQALRDAGNVNPPAQSPAQSPTPIVTIDEPGTSQQAAPQPNPTASVALADPVVAPAQPAAVTPNVENAAAALLESARTAQAVGDAPYETAMLIAALESLIPQLAEGEEQLITDTGLSADEQAALDAVKELLAGMQSPDAAAMPGRLADIAADVQQRLADASPVGVKKALLCTRVDGFGRYDPFASSAFLAGQRHRVIVYTEVDRFGHRLTSDSDNAPVSVSSEPTYTIDITQELNLYHDADGMLAWRRPAQGERTVARARLRDYYLVDLIELPETLTVGKYRLKVTIRDQSDGSVAESTIPIRIVADQALTAVDAPG